MMAVELRASVFDGLPIDGAMVTAVVVEPLKKLHLRLFYFPAGNDVDQSGKEFDLQFIKVIDFKIGALELSAKVVSHHACQDSMYLDSVKNRSPGYSAKFDNNALNHFQIVLDRGRVDVIAETVHCVVVWQA